MSAPASCRRRSSCCDAWLTARARPAVRVASPGPAGGPSIRAGPRARAKGPGRRRRGRRPLPRKALEVPGSCA
eukprot:3774688-Alexandrium_andersonii.AAC.1